MKCLIILAAVAAVVLSAPDRTPVSKAEFSSYMIIDGHDAKKGEAPYIVSLRSGSHFCAGSIIYENWVVTAAHCLIYPFFQVVAGLHSRKDESEAQIRTVPSKRHYIVHDKFAGDVGPNDIGLIYIADPFEFGDTVNKISLPSGKCRHVGDANLYGWGLDNTGSLPDILQVLNTSIIGYSNCKKELPNGAPIEKSNICSHNKGQIASSCSGDSGGPLVKKTRCDLELVGIVSWGYTPCVNNMLPSVHTHTNPHVKWMRNQIDYFQIPE